MKHDPDPLDRALAWSGAPSPSEARPRIEEYGRWLETEAMPAGALGPEETSRILDRHLADALCFAGVLGTPRPSTILDVGSGAGLPGIPIALAFPAIRVTLLDRSERRATLLRRAIRVLGLENVEVLEADVSSLDRTQPALTLRASVPPGPAMRVAARLLEPTGVAVLGLSRSQPPDEPHLGAKARASGVTITVVAVPAGVLDSPSWLLRMIPQ